LPTSIGKVLLQYGSNLRKHIWKMRKVNEGEGASDGFAAT